MDIEELAFVAAVRSHFSFLENEFGFRVVSHDTGCVRYESDAVFVEVFLEMPFFEIGLAIGLSDQLRPGHSGYSIHYLVRLHDGESYFRYQGRFARTKVEVDAAVDELAKLLHSCGARALRGDVDVFAAMRVISNFDMEQIRLRKIRSDAEAAFQNKEYRQSAELYSSMELHLTATEVKKLAYARKHAME